MNINPEGPAFPHVANDVQYVDIGMPILAYFAAHAPDTPDWFEHDEPPKKSPCLPSVQFEDPRIRRKVDDWLMDPCFNLVEVADGDADLENILREFQAAAYAHWDECRHWEQLNWAERFFQWRVHYAVTMIHQLNKETQ
jgi:hypothetical protein